MFSFYCLDKLHILLGWQWNNWIGPWGTWLLFDGYYFFFVRTGSLSHSLCGEHGLIKKLLFIMSYVNIYIYIYIYFFNLHITHRCLMHPWVHISDLKIEVTFPRPGDSFVPPVLQSQWICDAPVEVRADPALDLSKPCRSLGEKLGFSIYYCKADPPFKKKNQGGLPFTIVDVTLHQKINNPWFSLIRAWH